MGTSRYIRETRDKDMINNYRTSKLCERKKGLKCDYVIEEAEYIESEYLDIMNIKYESSSYRLDCTLNKIKYLKISGYVKDEFNTGVSGVMINLFKQVICNSQVTYLNKADAISDAIGYFQFVIYRDYDIDDYLVKISDGDILI
ncbi:hypothetical protein [uncultured Clostridium sp.]|jgi:hypothetical protein|uniref:hypothetical protein n=1 Tax=uncultured Clostridium sp. TaxID=59620 RepID=UPI002638414B|nr:hypothetical protein [uncultured Clostridium sp.]